MPEVFMIGGRAFGRATPTTFAQDEWVMGVLYRARLHDVIASGGDVLGAVLAARCGPELLAGLLAPAGVSWTPAVAALTQKAIGECVEAGEKDALRAALESILLDFFASAGTSSDASPPSSRRPRRKRAPLVAPTPTATPASGLTP